MIPADTQLRTLAAATAVWLLLGFGTAASAAPGDASEAGARGETTAASGTTDAGETTAASETTDASEGRDETDGDAGESGEVFIPTEEISEDFAVSFPVDI